MNGIVSSSTSALAVGCGTRDCPILFQYIVRKWICRCSCIICSSSPLFGEPFSVCLCEINIFFSLCDQVILHQNLEITVTRTCCEHLQSVVHKEVSLIFVINWITSRLSVSIVFVFTRKKKKRNNNKSSWWQTCTETTQLWFWFDNHRCAGADASAGVHVQLEFVQRKTIKCSDECCKSLWLCIS